MQSASVCIPWHLQGKGLNPTPMQEKPVCQHCSKLSQGNIDMRQSLCVNVRVPHNSCSQLQVVIQLTGSNKGASSAIEVEDQLAVLAEAAPDWLSLESNIEGKKIVRLRRKADVKAVRQKLVLMSSTRP